MTYVIVNISYLDEEDDESEDDDDDLEVEDEDLEVDDEPVDHNYIQMNWHKSLHKTGQRRLLPFGNPG